MELDLIKDLIATLGVPVAVMTWLLYERTQVRKGIEQKLDQLNESIKALLSYMKARD